MATAVLVAPAIVSIVPPVIVWGVLPAIAGLAVLAVSVLSTVQRPSATQMFLGIWTIALSVASLWALKRMFLDGAGATFLPYLAIALAVPAAVVQSYLARAE